MSVAFSMALRSNIWNFYLLRIWQPRLGKYSGWCIVHNIHWNFKRFADRPTCQNVLKDWARLQASTDFGLRPTYRIDYSYTRAQKLLKKTWDTFRKHGGDERGFVDLLLMFLVYSIGSYTDRGCLSLTINEKAELVEQFCDAIGLN